MKEPVPINASKKEIPMSDVKQAVQDLAAKIKPMFTLAVLPAADLYEKSLPEGITTDQIKAIQQHNTALVAATGLAVGELAIDAFKADKDLTRVSTEFAAVGDKISTAVIRSREYPAGGIPKEGEVRDPNAKIVKYGVIEAAYEVASNGNKGELKKVRTHIGALALAALGQ